jgi:type II secretory pathway pseudopilin PulG
VRQRAEAGYTLIMLMAAVTIMLITMGLGVPFWRYLVQDDREQELLFRGDEIADAIERYQQRNANAPPPSLEVLVEQRFLRRLYTDPMSEGGEWRLIRPGEAVGPVPPSGPGGALTGRATPTPTPAPASSRSLGAGPGGQVLGGGVIGVASTSKDESFRLLNGRDRYDEWLFIAGQPRVVGRQGAGPLPGLPGGAGSIGPTPLPKPAPSGLTPNRR